MQEITRAATRELTPRQREVLALIARGYTNAQIAEALGITLDGAKFHVSEILERLNVPSREDAADVWRAEHSLAGRVQAFFGALAGTKVLVAVSLVALVVVAGGAMVWLAGRGSGDSVDEPSLTQVVDAVRRPGKVFHTVGRATQSDYGASDATVFEEWYSADEGAVRRESETGQQPGSVSIYHDDTETMYDASTNQTYPPRPPGERPTGAPDGGIAGLNHLYLFLGGDGYSFVGEAHRDGQDLLQFETSHTVTDADGSEIATGTVFYTTLYLRQRDLLPVTIRSSVDTSRVAPPSPPATVGPGLPSSALEYLTAEFVDRSSLPTDFFDPAALGARQMTPEEALTLAANQPFATFWLGPELDIPWTQPNGETSLSQKVVSVLAPGMPGAIQAPAGGVHLVYGPSASLPLLDVKQGSIDSFEPLPQDEVDAMRAGGNIHDLDTGDGYMYASYVAAKGCTFEQAQRAQDCRLGTVARWGAIVERDGTRIQIETSPKLNVGLDHDSNPFSSAAAIRELVAALQPIPG